MGHSKNLEAVRVLWAAGLIAGLLHGLGDLLVAREALPAPLFGLADDLLLWLGASAVLTAVAGACGAMLGGFVSLVRRAGASHGVAAALGAVVVIAPLWIVNADLRPTSPLLYWVGLTAGTLGAAGLAFLGARRPLLAAAALAVIAVGAWTANLLVLPGLYRPQHASLALVSLATTTVAVAALLHARGAPSRRALLGLSVTAALLWLDAFVVLRGELGQGVRLALLGRSVGTAHAAQALEALADVDGDGVASLFGDADCDELDPSVHPGAVDTPDDGVDQDCMGGDATEQAIAELAAWQRSTALPPGAGRPAAGRSVVLITVDALRQDRGERMESVRRLAARGVSFHRAYAAYPSTILSFFAAMTGRAPSAIRTEHWVKWDVPTPDTSQTLPEVLQARGYRTEGIAFHHIFAPDHGLVRGFDAVWTASGDPKVVVESRSADQTADRAIAFLKRADPSRPFFLWAHFYDPHEPYLKHPDFPAEPPGGLAQLYDGELRFTDAHLGRLIDAMDESGELDRSIVVLTGDHGEALGDHGLQYHASALFDEQLRVPLVLTGPGVPRGEVRETPVGLLDLADTLADLLGVPPPADSQAASFAALVVAPLPDGAPPPPVFAEVDEDTGLQRMVVVWPWKLIQYVHLHTFELFDLGRDPGEHINVFDAAPDDARRLQSVLATWTARILR